MDRSHLRPPYPVLRTPSSTSAFQSSASSLSSMSSQSSTMSPTSPRRQMSAPLPSPTASRQQQQYFSSMDAPAAQQRMWAEQAAYQQSQGTSQAQAYQAQQYAQQQAYQQQQYAQQQYAHQQQQSGRVEGYRYQPDRSGAGSTAVETAQYISDYGLVAEAAKRAQMAVLMRDLEGVELR